VLRVLVVEDDADAANSLAQLLRLEGYEVQIARDGPAACAVAATSLPDVVLVDIALPGCNGYEVARRIRQQGTAAWPRPFLVAITGSPRDIDRERSRAVGIDLYFSKPIEPDVLLGFLRRLAAARPEHDAGH
jgi:CheY-like chemotaxis protein